MLWDGREVARRRAELGAIGAALIRSDPGRNGRIGNGGIRLN